MGAAFHTLCSEMASKKSKHQHTHTRYVTFQALFAQFNMLNKRVVGYHDLATRGRFSHLGCKPRIEKDRDLWNGIIDCQKGF